MIKHFCLLLLITLSKFIYAQQPDTIPFTLTDGNNIKISVLLNQVDTLDLYFDSGGTEVVLSHDAIAQKTSLLANMPEGFQTQDYETFNSTNSLQIGNLTWDSLDIYPVRHRGQGTDGSFGWDLFEGRVVELDYDKSIMVIHSSLPKKLKGYAKMAIEYTHTLFCVQGKLIARNKQYKNRFLFDTGYQRAVLLDSILVQEQQFPKDLPLLKVTRLRNGVGDVFVTKTVSCDQVKLGKHAAHSVPVQLLSAPNPARFKTHILGNEFLKRFNTFLDFQAGYVYMKPNGLMEVPYVDGA